MDTASELPLETLSLEESRQLRRRRNDSRKKAPKMDRNALLIELRSPTALNLEEAMFTDENDVDDEEKKYRDCKAEVYKLCAETADSDDASGFYKLLDDLKKKKKKKKSTGAPSSPKN